MAADRGIFIDQSQSLNIYMSEANYSKMTSMHFYGWKKGLKTGMYYLRTQSAADPIKVTISPQQIQQVEDKKRKRKNAKKNLCSIQNKEECLSCGS